MDVIGFGAINCDKIYKVDKIASPGQEVGVMSVAHHPGGSAPNTAVGLARLGVKTGVIGVVGQDKEGTALLEDLKKEGVEATGIRIKEGNTGTALIFIDKYGERTIYILPSVNDDYSPSDYEYAKTAKFLHLCSFMSREQLKKQINFVKKLKSSKIKISFSPGDIYSNFGLDALKPIIELSHVVFLNKYETELLTNLDYCTGALSLVAMGAQIVVVTLGNLGCFLAIDSHTYAIPAYESKVADTVGAGDAFAAGFIYGMLVGEDACTCGRYGNLLASMSISKFGSRKGLLKNFKNLGEYL
ncbi:MAG: carbohydrate kinase family protein [Halobacteriota archaeon]